MIYDIKKKREIMFEKSCLKIPEKYKNYTAIMYQDQQ